MPQVNLTIAANGRVVIPSSIRALLGVQEGGRLVARMSDGRLVLEPIDLAIERARAIIRRRVPPGTDIVGELIAERHASADE